MKVIAQLHGYLTLLFPLNFEFKLLSIQISKLNIYQIQYKVNKILAFIKIKNFVSMNAWGC